MNSLIKKLREIGVVQHGKVSLRGGDISDVYVDIRKAYGNPEVLESIADCLWEKMHHDVTCIAACGYGGISPASVLAIKHHLHLTLLRESQKTHGLQGKVEGYVPGPHDSVVLLDDVFTTGSSVQSMLAILAPTHAAVIGCTVLVKRGEGIIPIPLSYVFTLDDLTTNVHQ